MAFTQVVLAVRHGIAWVYGSIGLSTLASVFSLHSLTRRCSSHSDCDTASGLLFDALVEGGIVEFLFGKCLESFGQFLFIRRGCW